MSDGFFHLFAYGTLAHGRGGAADDAPRSLMRGCVKVGEGHVRGTLYDLGDYPALMLAGSQRVRGEIWRCPAERLWELDRYEGVEEGLFRRVGVRVGETACWVYVAGPRLGPRLKRTVG